MIRITIESGKIVIETDEMPKIIHKQNEIFEKQLKEEEIISEAMIKNAENDILFTSKLGKTCPECGKHYIQRGNAQIYCSPECKVKAKAKIKKIESEVDQAIIEAPEVDQLQETINRVMDKPEKSHPEQLDEIIERQKQKQKVKKICPECGKEFEQIHPYQIYCSELCRNQKAQKRREEKLKTEVREEMKKEPSLEGKIPLFIEKLKATFFVNRHMTEEQREEYAREKIRAHEEKLKIK